MDTAPETWKLFFSWAKPLWLSVEGGLEGSARATAGVVTSASHAHLTVSSRPEDLGTSRGGM